jgi:hypothetical protein
MQKLVLFPKPLRENFTIFFIHLLLYVDPCCENEEKELN